MTANDTDAGELPTLVGPAVRAQPFEQGHREHALRRKLFRAAFIAVAAAATVALYIAMKHHVMNGSSDEATPVLQAQTMLHGNPLLSGWRLKYDSFWAVDDLFYAVAVLVVGVSPSLIYVVPALVATAVVFMAAAMTRVSGSPRASAAGIITVIAIVGLPSGVWGTVLLQSAWGIGSILYCLIAVLVLRKGAWNRYWPLAVLLLTLGLLSDLKVLVYGVVPIVGAGLLTMIRFRSVRAGLPSVVAGVSAIAAALLGRHIMTALGTWQIGEINFHAQPHQIPGNLASLPGFVGQVFGVGVGNDWTSGVPHVWDAVHLISVLLVIVAFLHAGARSAKRLVRRQARTPEALRADWLTDFLLLAIVADVAFFVYSKYFNAPIWIHYLAPLVVYGGILAGRLTARVAADLGHSPFAGRGVARQALVLSAAVVLLGYVGSSVRLLRTPSQPVEGARLATFLESHGLTSGLGAYWEASSTTLASGDRVQVRPVIAGPDGRLVRWGRQSTAVWYAGKTFNFVVYNARAIWIGTNETAAVKTFGPFSRAYQVGVYRVLVWDHPFTISSAPYGD